MIPSGDNKIEKQIFHHFKNPFFKKDVGISVLKSNKISDEKNYKYFIDYMDDDCKIKSLCMMLPKTSTYVKSYDDKTKWMYFSIADD